MPLLANGVTDQGLGEESEANEAGNAVLDDVAFHWGSGDHLQYPLPYQITNPLHPGKSRGVAAGKLLLGGRSGAGKAALGCGVQRGRKPWGVRGGLGMKPWGQGAEEEKRSWGEGVKLARSLVSTPWH